MTDKKYGFELFNDIEDVALRLRNRAVVMTNMYEDNSKNGKLSPRGAARLLGYFDAVPKEERQTLQEAFVVHMKERGFAISR